MGWMWLKLGDAEPVRFPDDESVLAVASARGFVAADDPDAPRSGPNVDPDEVDVHGQGWVYLTHAETGGAGRFPVEVAGQMYHQGWVKPKPEPPPKKSTAKKKSETPVESDTPEEK